MDRAAAQAAGLVAGQAVGMGEPLDSWANLEKALRIMNAPEGLGIAARRMTVSTAGFAESFKKVAALDLQINLSLSLHAVTDRLRDSLKPINPLPARGGRPGRRGIHPGRRPDDHAGILRHRRP